VGVVRRKVGRPRKTPQHGTRGVQVRAPKDVEPVRREVVRPRKAPQNDTGRDEARVSMDRAQRHINFVFSNGVVERPYGHDTRAACPRLTRSARKCIGLEHAVTDSGWRTKIQADQHISDIIL
jgi:hypothetical protein